MLTLANTSCPLCESTATALKSTIAVEPILAAWSQEFGIDARSEIGERSTFDLWECRTCSMQYFQPSDLVGSPNLYEQLSRHDWYYKTQKWEHKVALKDLRGRQRILEIGCGDGEFIVKANHEGLPIEGLEQNPSALNAAREHGLNVSALTLEEVIKERASQYDAVCSFQVLEHVTRPMEFLASCVKLLSPGGILLLGLPNLNSFLRYQFNILDLPPHHMTRWSARVLQYVPRIYPIRLDKIRFEPLAIYSVEPYLAAQLGRLQNSLMRRYVNRSRPRKWMAKALTSSGLRSLLRGQTLYAVFSRLPTTS